MKRCVALVSDGGSPNAWRQCRRYSRAKSVFCSAHEEAVTGTLLGLIVYLGADADKLRDSLLEEMPVKSRVPS
jgi:tetrahydromethanopterin S-methyltransferase subunit E